MSAAIKKRAKVASQVRGISAVLTAAAEIRLDSAAAIKMRGFNRLAS